MSKHREARRSENSGQRREHIVAAARAVGIATLQTATTGVQGWQSPGRAGIRTPEASPRGSTGPSSDCEPSRGLQLSDSEVSLLAHIYLHIVSIPYQNLEQQLL